ncbi:DUF3261 domain-containing protein [Colwellia sp. D2M02]|uniref:DUF3261 domain-containing protein n=1 Tax=Colwellia sp. D2M02 TaxID=2841562 RepID=UPI001C07F3B1|nr:DUF3261 domain-containing protein [Colwellia sp. D2M02]MBU2892009.1 DUF3261 domain-containing protein [Colwellia sp. D2M02]
MPVKIFSLILLLLLSGCARNQQTTNAEQQIAPQITIAEQVTLLLSKAPAQLVGQDFQHLLAINHQNKRYSVLMQVQISEPKVDVVAVSLQGIPLFEMASLADGTITSKSYVNLTAIEPAFIMADFQLVYWPITTLNTMLNGAIITEEKHGDALLRKVIANDKSVIKITITNTQVSFDHLTRNYQLLISPIES